MSILTYIISSFSIITAILIGFILYCIKEKFSIKAENKILKDRITYLGNLSETIKNKNIEIEELKENIISFKLKIKEIETKLENEKKNADEKIKILTGNSEFLKNEFKNIAGAIINDGNKKLALQNSSDLKNILSPFKEQIENFRKKIELNHENEIKERASLRQEIQNLRELNREITTEASNLTKALNGNKKIQGNWGEMILESVLEKSGLEKGREYIREVYFKDGDKIKRPDVIINLPDNRHLVVDSKVSLKSYQEYCNAETPEKENEALKAHIQCIRNHIKSLSEKEYSSISKINSPDMVFMFMPVEPAFYIAFKNDESIFSLAFEKKIVVVTPSTLLATLKTVANLWRLEKQNQSAEKLFIHASMVYKKLVAFLSHLEAIGKQIEKLELAYSKSMKNLSTGKNNLISLSLKFKEFGFETNKDIPNTILEKATMADTDKN